jgi:hypothetical protein
VVGRAGDDSPDKRDRQSRFFSLPAAVARLKAATSPSVIGNKKAHSDHGPWCPGQWPTVPSVDSLAVCFQTQHLSIVDSLLHAKSGMTAALIILLCVGRYCQSFFVTLWHLCRDAIAMMRPTDKGKIPQW